MFARNKKLLGTSASLLVTSALLVVTMFARNKKLLGTSASLLVTSALLVVTMFARNKKLLGTNASLLVTSALLVVTMFANRTTSCNLIPRSWSQEPRFAAERRSSERFLQQAIDKHA